METALIFFGVIVSFLLLAVLLVVAKLLFDTSGSVGQSSTVYMLKVSPNGDLKIKRYRGRVKYWSDMES